MGERTRMELFTEIHNCYYQVLRHLLCSQDAVTIEDMCGRIREEGFEESMLAIIPKIESGAWQLFEREGAHFLSKIAPDFLTPLTELEKRYLKALLADPRIGLFLSREQRESLDSMLSDVTPLWKQEHFYYYDRFADGDPYDDDTYRTNFRTLLTAQKNRQYVDLDYTSPRGARVHHYYVPARLEYSVKNDKFRVLALERTRHRNVKLEILNVARIDHVTLTDQKLSADVDLNAAIRGSYYKEPLRLRIINKRNALERAMLHFANYEKNTVKIDEDTYECLIYYNQSMETELLIEVLSFGPMLTVLGNDRFLKSLKQRLERQKKLSDERIALPMKRSGSLSRKNNAE